MTGLMGAEIRALAQTLHPSVCENAGTLGLEHLPSYLPEPECEHVARSVLERGLAVTRQPWPGQRLILASDNLFDLFGTRTESGDLLTYQWGEPDENGWYTPIMTTVHDEVAADIQAAIDRRVREMAES